MKNIILAIIVLTISFAAKAQRQCTPFEIREAQLAIKEYGGKDAWFHLGEFMRHSPSKHCPTIPSYCFAVCTWQKADNADVCARNCYLNNAPSFCEEREVNMAATAINSCGKHGKSAWYCLQFFMKPGNQVTACPGVNSMCNRICRQAGNAGDICGRVCAVKKPRPVKPTPAPYKPYPSEPSHPPYTPVKPKPHMCKCAAMTSHGVAACMRRSGCDWSLDSNSCYSKNGMQCSYYTRHGVKACMQRQDCNFSLDSNQCHIKAGQSCSYYTPHGVKACMHNRYCDWSLNSNSCYRK